MIGSDLLVELATALGVVLFWRGVWPLCDVFIFPERKQLSAWITVVMGVILILITGSFHREW